MRKKSTNHICARHAVCFECFRAGVERTRARREAWAQRSLPFEAAAADVAHRQGAGSPSSDARAPGAERTARLARTRRASTGATTAPPPPPPPPSAPAPLIATNAGNPPSSPDSGERRGTTVERLSGCFFRYFDHAAASPSATAKGRRPCRGAGHQMRAFSRDRLQVLLVCQPAFGSPDALVRERRERAVEDEAEDGDYHDGAGNQKRPALVLAAEEDRRNREERSQAEKADREPQVSRPYEHPLIVQHAERAQLLVHGDLEVAEVPTYSTSGLRQGNGNLFDPFLSECQVRRLPLPRAPTAGSSSSAGDAA